MSFRLSDDHSLLAMTIFSDKNTDRYKGASFTSFSLVLRASSWRDLQPERKMASSAH